MLEPSLVTVVISESTRVKVRDFQKKISIIYRPKQICRYTIFNLSFITTMLPFAKSAFTLSELANGRFFIKQNVVSKIQV